MSQAESMQPADARPPWMEVARNLAVVLASATAMELAGRSSGPVVEFTRHPWDCAFVGERVEVHAQVSFCDFAYVEIPGETRLRDFVPDEPIIFTATTNGCVVIEAHNALTPPVRAASHPIRVITVPEVPPYTFPAPEVAGMTAKQLDALADGLLTARSSVIDLNPAAATYRSLSSHQDPAPLLQIDSLVSEIQSRVSDASRLIWELDLLRAQAGALDSPAVPHPDALRPPRTSPRRRSLR